MHPLIDSKTDAIRALCLQHGVRSLYLFGSAADGSFDAARSDLDFLVEFVPAPRLGFRDPYFKLQRDLAQLFGRQVDLVETGTISNPIVRASVEGSKIPLYAAA